ncbi:amyloid protein-binding protein 2-like [Anopheles aquasalis]|uniref:amyloid protein-binding protein 2-like n=1 Tax=Anopheles aquasalis TaxID=42839 RepID=UPI00215B322A|nr:amyloid protein-binding protein 2-like [Anopheles aquasalis]
MRSVARFWPLADVHLERRGDDDDGDDATVAADRASASKPRTLYRCTLEALVRHYSNNPRSSGYRAAVQCLPLAVRLEVLEDMCDYPHLLDEQQELLSDPVLISEALRQLPADRTKLVRCFQWLECNRRPVTDRLCQRFQRACVKLQVGNEDRERDGIRRGLTIAGFLTETGWLREAIKILRTACLLAKTGSEVELEVLRQLLRAQSLGAKGIEARQTCHRLTATVVRYPHLLRPPQQTPSCYDGMQCRNDVAVGTYLALSLYELEMREITLSYHYAVMALEMLTDCSPGRLIVDVCRQLAKACLTRKQYARTGLLMRQAIAWARNCYGKGSAQYAETLEDYAMYLLARNAVTESVGVFAEAQHIYLRLYGPRNLLLAHAQGNLVFGLCLQAYVHEQRERAVQHVENSMANFERILPHDHRLLVQGRRLRSSMDLLLFDVTDGTGRRGGGGGDGPSQEEKPQAVEQELKLDKVGDGPLAVHVLRRSFYLGPGC